MSVGSLSERIALADRVRKAQQELATAIADEFFLRHPDWLDKCGERGRRLGLEDAAFHVEFLAAAIEAGEVASFVRYAQWTRGMLEARDIAPEFLAENLASLGRELKRVLPEQDYAVVLRFIDAALDSCRTALPPMAPVSAEVDVFTQALLAGNRTAALNVIKESLRRGLPVEEIYLGIVEPSMYEIGRLWQANQITVAREHMATATAQFVLSQVFQLINQESPRSSRGNAVITGVEGEMHQVGPLMVSDLLELDGWNVSFLGANVPHSGVISTIDQVGASLLGVSTTMLFNLKSAATLIADARRRFPSIKILVGGAAFRGSENFWREAGADAFAENLQSAREIVRAWSE